jgi:hypothetical protein
LLLGHLPQPFLVPDPFQNTTQVKRATMSTAANVLQGFDEYKDDASATTTATLASERRLFTPKWQHSTKNNPLCGICFPEWFKIMKQRHHQIEWTVYWPRLLVITLLSLLNSFLGLIESILYESKIQDTEIHPSPVFVLGHPRTGTTLLHSLLALDDAQFDVCTTFCAGFPSCFLWFESIGKIIFRGVIDDTRPMDNVRLDFDLPQEDELATNVLSAGISPYMPLFLMKQEPEFRPYFSFEDDTTAATTTTNTTTSSTRKDTRLPPDIMAAARKGWTTSFLYLLKKLSLRSILKSSGGGGSPPKRLVLKSPVHTARIPLLLQLFPEAQFIYIHRHPYDVLQSAIHMADTTYWYTYMNSPTQDEILEFILRQYEILWETYEEGRRQLSTRQLMEVSFDQLVQDPPKTMEGIYQGLGWTISAAYKARLAAELKDSHNHYKRNDHKQLPDYLKAIVDDRWGPSFDRLGYSKERD